MLDVSSLTQAEIELIKHLPVSEQMSVFLGMYEQDPSEAIKLKLKLEIPTHPGLLAGMTKVQLANLMGVRTEQVDVMARNGMPVEQSGRDQGKSGRQQSATYNAGDVLEWLVEQKRRKITDDNDKVQEAEIAFRLEKVKLQELKRRQMEGELVDVSHFNEVMTKVLTAIREAIDKLRQSHGEEIWQDLTALLDEQEQVIFGDG